MGGRGRRQLSSDERTALRHDLERIQRSNSLLVGLVVVLLLVLFVAWMVIVFGDAGGAGGTGQSRVATVGFGLTAAGCVGWLLAVWREKSSIALLLRLAVDLEGEALAAVVNVLSIRRG